MTDQSTAGSMVKCIAALLAANLFALPVLAQSNKTERTPSAPPAASAAKDTATPSTARKVSPYRPTKLAEHANNRYVAAWGVDKMKVSHTASGNLIRFSYRVTDPERAKVLGDKKATPLLYGQRSKAVLQIPVMDKVGQLRQTGVPQAGQEYWMVFSNKGNLVKRGDRVNVAIGSFRVEGLMVE